MSYDIYLVDKETQETIDLKTPHNIYGNTYCKEETELYLNLTFNYREYFIKVFGEDGIHWLNGKTAKDTYSKIAEGINTLLPVTEENFEVDNDPWNASIYNTVTALKKLLQLALLAPYGIWEVYS